MDERLEEYLISLRADHENKEFPNFCPFHSHNIDDKKILVVLSNPGNVEYCSITNCDPTSYNQREVILEKFRLCPSNILFWNFYPYKYGITGKSAKQRKIWAIELRKLARLLINLKVIVACGNDVHHGMEHWKSINNVEKINVPSPGPQAYNRREYRNLYISGWKKVKKKC